jgi:phosphoribosyl-AMP cyclohydrolase / phosphoribosyl-ATP pyrophosphohydrolase
MNLDQVRFDERGLVPAIVQDAESGEVLMLAYMNRESLEKTLERGETWFWSRSRQKLWHKGETSGSKQGVVSIRQDCDGDALLVRVRQHGVACHTGTYSCFDLNRTLAGSVGKDSGESKSVEMDEGSLGEILGEVARVIRSRRVERPEGSYTVKMLDAGIDRILKKVGEESGEVIIAAKNHSKEEIAWEVADLLYHTLVMLELEGVSLGRVGAQLRGRRGGK